MSPLFPERSETCVADEGDRGPGSTPGRIERTEDMLVLTRKLMEKLFIGDDICVTIVRLEGGQVRLGIDAPREVKVVRAELVPERSSRPGSDRITRQRPNRPTLRLQVLTIRGTWNR